MNDIRPAQPEDSEAIKELISTTLLHSVFEEGDAYRALFGEICALIDSWAAEPGDIVHLVCHCQGCIVGIIFVSQYQTVNLLFVGPDHQRAGIGSALLNHALDACRRSGKSRRVTLNSTSYAEAFYLKRGFARVGPPKDLPGGCIPLAVTL